MDEEEIEKEPPSQVSRNVRGKIIKAEQDDSVKVNITSIANNYIFRIKITSTQKLILLFFASQTNLSIQISLSLLESHLSLTRHCIVKNIDELIKLKYLVKIKNKNKEHNGSEANSYSLTNMIFEIN